MTDMDTFLAAHPDIEVFEVFMPDLNGKLRGKWLPRDKLGKVFSGGMKIPLSSQAFDIWGNDNEEYVMASGDADGICIPEPRTLHPAPWLERATGQLLVSMQHPDGTPSAMDSRQILARLQRKLESRGFQPVMACELEFHLLRGLDERGRPLHAQTTGDGETAAGGETYGMAAMQDMSGLMHAIRDAAMTQDLPVDTLIKESAPSQYEVNLYHEPDALLSADQGLLLRRVIQGVCARHGYRATFMAKPFTDISGNGQHIHCSLLDAEGKNAFDDGTSRGTDLLRKAVAGCLVGMPDCMALFAPHANSYRRFAPGAHAPLSPTWGYENRTVALRIPADKPAATRIEHRVAGADASSHLVSAAILAGILHGIDHDLEAPEPLNGNAYERQADLLPRSWDDALQRFERSGFVREYFGEEFQRVYALVKRQELERFALDISSFEYSSYL